MPLSQTMYNHQNVPVTNITNNGHLNYSNYQQPQQPQPLQATSSTFGPSRVLDINLIRQMLGYDETLSESICLCMARDAILHGFMEQEKTIIAGQICHRFLYQNKIFVLTEGFDAVVTIIWDQQNHLIGDNHSSTFHRNTNYNNNINHTANNNQFISSQQQIAHPVYVETNPSPLRHAVIQQQQQQQQQQHPQPLYYQQQPQCKANNIAYQAHQAPPAIGPKFEGLDEDSSEYECIIDEIVNFVDNDVDNDPDFADFHVLPPLPPPSLPPNKTNQLQNQSSFYSINTDDNHSEIKYKAQSQYVQPSNHRALSSTSSGCDQSGTPPLETHGIEIKISDKLWKELFSRFYPSFTSKQELISLIQEAIHINRAPINQIGEQNQWLVWLDRHYIYITEQDMSTLINVLPIECYQSLINNTNTNVSNFRTSKLVKNSSKRSVISNISTSSINTSRRSVFTEPDMKKTNNNNNNNNKKHEYHTIYLKPIIERMKQITYSMEGMNGGNNKYASIDNDYIIDIVDNSIKFGVKRQISKRTFEFKWKSYTIIMSKSLKTILDVTLSTDKNIITVHPDVVSIISKKCPVLDYFTIQKLANRAKLTASFTTKKNDYRQQFIYEYCGCRIVFASNHTTIVEMQCNDNSANNMKLIKEQTTTNNKKY